MRKIITWIKNLFCFEVVETGSRKDLPLVRLGQGRNKDIYSCQKRW